MTYEYAHDVVPHSDDAVEKLMVLANARGRLGWRLVESVLVKDGAVVLFEREVGDAFTTVDIVFQTGGVFTGTPRLEFVEAELPNGNGVGIGEWVYAQPGSPGPRLRLRVATADVRDGRPSAAVEAVEVTP